ncbi:hypothetical protein THASP1DRAFT_24115, partial [Thamnocephalis sphaerospora]
FPHFGLLQPEGTQPVYSNHTDGRVKGINFVNTKGVAVLKAQVSEHVQIHYAILKAYSEDGNTMIDYAYLEFSHGGDGNVPYSTLRMRTPRGAAEASQPEYLFGACVIIGKEEEAFANSIVFPGEEPARFRYCNLRCLSGLLLEGYTFRVMTYAGNPVATLRQPQNGEMPQKALEPHEHTCKVQINTHCHQAECGFL